MVLLKNVLKITVISITLLIISIACSSDSSDTEQKPEEVIIEDFANFKDDPKFLEYMEQSVIPLRKIKDASKALELLMEAEQLDDNQKLDLANALGFDTKEEMDSHYNKIVIIWEELVIRFDLRNQNIDKEDLNQIINDTYLTFAYEILDSIDTKEKK